jgi:hypothetical protein
MSSAFRCAFLRALRSSTTSPSAASCSRAAWRYGHPGLTTPIGAFEDFATTAPAGRIVPSPTLRREPESAEQQRLGLEILIAGGCVAGRAAAYW